MIILIQIFVNDTLLTVEKLVKEEEQRLSDIDHFTVRKGTENVYSFSIERSVDLSMSFFAWDDDWILEYKDKVIVSGVDIGEKNNYQKVFYFREFKGKPFYFFKQNEEIFISYAGEILSCRYDEVIHNKCCELGFFNVTGNEDMIWFYALKDGFWYYVEVGVYK